MESWIPEFSGGGSRNSQPQTMRVDLPSFDGDNPSNWVYKAIRYFDYYQIPENQRIKLASFHMEGDALIWFYDGEDSGLFPYWDVFVRELQIRFEPEKEQESVEQKGSAIEKLEEIYGEEIQEEARNEHIKNTYVASGEKVDTTEIITNETEKCDQQHQDIKHEDLLKQHLGKLFSAREEHYCDAEHVFDIKLKRNLEDSVLFQWCGRWKFDPGIRKRLPTSIPPSTQPLTMRKNDLVCGLSGNGSGSKLKMRHNFLVLSSFVFQSLTGDSVIFVMWKHRWRWKTGGEPCQWVEERSFRSNNLVVHDLMRDERVRSKGLVIRKRLHLMLYNSMYRMMLEAKFESQEDPLLIDVK